MLMELGLSPAATTEDIENAYRRLVLEYHPDRLASLNLPPHIQRLAQAKIATINAAYQGLMGRSVPDGPLWFRGLTETERFVGHQGQSFPSRCWLCDRINQISAGADLAMARCGECHALLGHHL